MIVLNPIFIQCLSVSVVGCEPIVTVLFTVHILFTTEGSSILCFAHIDTEGYCGVKIEVINVTWISDGI